MNTSNLTEDCYKKDSFTEIFKQYDIYHMGIVVEDVQLAVEQWSRVYGAGPFHMIVSY